LGAALDILDRCFATLEKEQMLLLGIGCSITGPPESAWAVTDTGPGLGAQLFRLSVFVVLVVLVYYLAIRWLWVRRRRASSPGSRVARWFRSGRAGAAILGVAGLGLLCIIYGCTLAPDRLTVRRYTVATAKLEPGEHVRIVHLSDLHVRAKGHRERTLPGIVRDLKPDLILHTGDLFGLGHKEALVTALLRSFDAPQFVSEGNLDVLGDYGGVIRETGLHALSGDTAAVEIRGVGLSISGFASGMEDTMRPVLDRLSDETFNIVLYHHPEGFPQTWDTPADLMLAGHTHGGQVCLPFYGAIITLDRYGKRWESGQFYEHDTHLIVSRGVGCEPVTPELRFWCPPEVVVVDLVGAEPAAPG